MLGRATVGATVLASVLATGAFAPASASGSAAKALQRCQREARNTGIKPKEMKKIICTWALKGYKGSRQFPDPVVAISDGRCWTMDASSNTVSSLILGSGVKTFHFYDGKRCRGKRS